MSGDRRRNRNARLPSRRDVDLGRKLQVLPAAFLFFRHPMSCTNQVKKCSCLAISIFAHPYEARQLLILAHSINGKDLVVHDDIDSST